MVYPSPSNSITIGEWFLSCCIVVLLLGYCENKLYGAPYFQVFIKEGYCSSLCRKEMWQWMWRLLLLINVVRVVKL
jgi:hypothetical protein